MALKANSQLPSKAARSNALPLFFSLPSWAFVTQDNPATSSLALPQPLKLHPPPWTLPPPPSWPKKVWGPYQGWRWSSFAWRMRCQVFGFARLGNQLISQAWVSWWNWHKVWVTGGIQVSWGKAQSSMPWYLTGSGPYSSAAWLGWWTPPMQSEFHS